MFFGGISTSRYGILRDGIITHYPPVSPYVRFEIRTESSSSLVSPQNATTREVKDNTTPFRIFKYYKSHWTGKHRATPALQRHKNTGTSL